MVAVESLEVILQRMAEPYQKKLALSLPVRWETNNEGAIMAIAAKDRSHHVVSIDPNIQKYRWIDSPLPFPCEEDDAAVLYSLLNGLCELHLAERIDPVISMPYVLDKGREFEDFSLFHNYAVNVLVDDVLYRQWPEVMAKSCEYQNLDGLRMVLSILKGGSTPLEMSTMVCTLAELTATQVRHQIGLERERTALEVLMRCIPSMARLVESYAKVWSSMPNVTYDREKDLRNYEDIIKRTARVARFTGNPHLGYNKKKDRYEWSI
jgi:hypothetical protein